MYGISEKLRASGIHLGLSVLVAALVAAMVFLVWYPYPYRLISGGRDLFLMVIAVDVIIGPLITFVVFSEKKQRRELIADFSVVIIIQLAALGYGMWTVYIARPVYLVFEYNRVVVVHAADVDVAHLSDAPVGYRAIPLAGPKLLSLRQFKDATEKFDSTMLALGGGPLSAQPRLWQSWDDSRAEIIREAKPVNQLKQKFEDQAENIDGYIRKISIPEDEILYLPLLSRRDAWTALIDKKSSRPIGFIPLDSF